MLVATDLHKTYQMHKVEIPVLRGLSVEVSSGEFLSIVGQSGSGKSTLLHLLGTLDTPDRGEIYFEDRRIDNLPADQRDYVRNQLFGLIFQFYHLLPELTVLENILMPQMIHNSAFGWWRHRRRLQKRAMDLLDRFEIADRAKHKPSEISGGEMQRAAIARSLINNPRILLADEPTGNLDETTGRQIMDYLHDLNRRDGVTIIMVTHNSDLAAETDRTVRLTAGRVEEEAHPAPPYLAASS